MNKTENNTEVFFSVFCNGRKAFLPDLALCQELTVILLQFYCHKTAG